MAEHDAKILVELLDRTESQGRKGPIFSGYRGAHLIKDEYLTSGSIGLIDREQLFPGESCLAYVVYNSPEHYPKSLWIGKKMRLQEGRRVIGFTTIQEVYNKILLADFSNLTENEIEKSSLEIWHENLQKKPISAYTIADLAKCLRQQISTAEVFPLALIEFEKNQDAENIYDGELFFSLIRAPIDFWENYLTDLKRVYLYSNEVLKTADFNDRILLQVWELSITTKYENRI